MRQNTKIFIEAISTPLASIFGSGFLVIIPVLAAATGAWMVAAMAAVAAFAFCVGEVIRHNITHAEPAIEEHRAKKSTLTLERVSDLCLVLAYIISVTLYLQIASAFVLTGFDANTQFNQSAMTSVIIAIIVIIAMTKGLHGLTFLEEWALAVTFFVIALVLLGFGIYDVQQEELKIIATPDIPLWETLTVVAGTLIVVQGFETPRYLAEEYSTELRIQTSRWSQIISSAVYIAFVALALPVLHELGGEYAENTLFHLVGFTVIPFIGGAVILAAVLSQFSAAVADVITAEGNVHEVSDKKIKAKHTFLAVGLLAIGLAWFADIFALVVLASKGFALYYFMQCLVALTVAKGGRRKAFISFVAAGLLFVVVFAASSH